MEMVAVQCAAGVSGLCALLGSIEPLIFVHISLKQHQSVLSWCVGGWKLINVDPWMDLWATLTAEGYVRASFAAAASPVLLHAAGSAVARHCSDCRMLKKDYPSYACLPTRMRRMLILARSFSFLIFTLHISISEVLPSFARAAFRALRPVIFVHHDHSVHIHVIFLIGSSSFIFPHQSKSYLKWIHRIFRFSFQLSLCWVFLLWFREISYHSSL